jgi:uridine kinase
LTLKNQIINKPRFIGIAGLSGSGKTALAHKVAARLEGQSTAITLDSYYHAQADLPLAERAKLNYDHPDSLDWALLHRHLLTLAGGESIDEPIYRFDLHTRDTATRRVHPATFVILEGILALHFPEIRDMLDLKVFVVTEPAECLRRRLERDIAERGRTRASVMEQYDSTVWPMALEYVLPTRAFADLIVSGEEPIDHAVDQVLRRLSSLTGRAAAAAAQAGSLYFEEA